VALAKSHQLAKSIGADQYHSFFHPSCWAVNNSRSMASKIESSDPVLLGTGQETSERVGTVEAQSREPKAI
jgi:hypothetical protein